MTAIPRSALILGLAGLIPFLWGAANVVFPPSGGWAGAWLAPMFRGTYVSLTYGVVILSFMSGVLWGFATRAKGAKAAVGYALSVVPALWGFIMVNGDPVDALSVTRRLSYDRRGAAAQRPSSRARLLPRPEPQDRLRMVRADARSAAGC